MQMKMAKADTKDLDAATLLCSMLCDVFEDRELPRSTDGEFHDEDAGRFDADDRHHLRVLYDRIKHCMDAAPGGLRRVIWGMHTVLFAENEIVNPAADTLELLPRLVKALEGEERAAADIAFLAERSGWAGHCLFTEDREVGISSNSIVAIAYGLRTLAQQELPCDWSDLQACERTVAKLPTHRRTADVESAIAAARKVLQTASKGARA